MNVNEYYISAIRIKKEKNGIEYISHVKAHAKYGGIVKKAGQKLPAELVISMMPRSRFYAARWDRKQKVWIRGIWLTYYQSETGKYYVIPDPEGNVNELYDLSRF